MNTIQNNLKNRYSAILMGLAVLMSGLWGAIAQAAPLSAKMRAAAKQMQKQKQQQAKKQQQKVAPKQKQASKKVAPKVAPKKQQPPKRQQPAKKQQGKVLSDSEKALLAKAQWLAGLVKKDLSNKSVVVNFECVDAENVAGFGAAYAQINYTGPNKIVFGAKVKDFPLYKQPFYILHELAHVYDPVLRNNGGIMQSFDDYPHLKKYIKAYNNKIKSMIPCEWHADWQAIQWMKKYTPERAQELRDYYNSFVAAGIQYSHFPQYAPYELMAQWLS